MESFLYQKYILYEKPDWFPYKGVDLRLTSLIYVMVSCMVITSASGHQAPDTIEHHRRWAPPRPPPPGIEMWYNWLWRVMQLLSRVCWKKVIFLLRIMLLYGAASLHWATTCWDPEGGKNRIKNSKSNIYRPFSGCAQWNVLPRGRVDLHQIYHVHYCSEINKDINNNKLNVL